jgi:LTXXQ motif family protein
MKTRFALVLAAGALLLPLWVRAQTGLPPGPMGGRNQQGMGTAIKDVLDLTDRQFNELNDLRDSHNKKLQDFGTQLRELDKQRRDALAAGDNAALVGSIAFQVQQIQLQMDEENKPYYEEALTLLDSGQREKVEQIQEAIKLAGSAGALMQYGLLDTSKLPVGGNRGTFLGGPVGRMNMGGPDGPGPGNRAPAPPPTQ